jgi:FtsP/CotA-like multicopper oxidase with cupredoxin domain
MKYRKQHHVQPTMLRQAGRLGAQFAAKNGRFSTLRLVAGHISPKMVRIGPMASHKSLLNRRKLIAGFTAVAASPFLPAATQAQKRQALILTSLPIDSDTGADPVESSRVWALLRPPPDHGTPVFTRGDELALQLVNYLPMAAVLNWYGLNGVPEAEPLLRWAPSAADRGFGETLVVPLRHAGTTMFDLGLLGDGQKRSTRPLGFIIRERQPIEVDRDLMLMIEERRLRPDGTSIAPGAGTQGTTAFSSSSSDIVVRANERLRLRFINGSHRSVIAVKLENLDVRVMAIDGQPAEPFQARNGAVVLAPGTRVDAFVDATASSSILLHDGKEARSIGKLTISDEPPVRVTPLPPAAPLPSNGLPAKLDLKGATRVDLTLGGPQADWITPAAFAAAAAPAFRAKSGRTVVLALTNRAEIPTVFHLHGHHFRLLDRLDDGWKPFWLDTLAIDAGQTQRIAFAAEYVGRWLIESVATDWAAPRLVRWYSVE